MFVETSGFWKGEQFNLFHVNRAIISEMSLFNQIIYFYRLWSSDVNFNHNIT